MAPIMAKKGAVSVKAYAGDAKTLLAFNLEGKAARKHLASFTLQVTPPGTEAYYAYNNLHFERKAFVRRFDLHAPIQPKSHDLIFDTSQLAGGGNAQGQSFTFADEYQWLGFTARAAAREGF